MKERIVEYLSCPKCRADLSLKSTGRESPAGEILEGELICPSCGMSYPIKAGIPRFVQETLAPEEEATASSFAWAWKRYGPHLSPSLNNEFLVRLPMWNREDFQDKLVVDVGCGAGRLSRLASEFGAREVFAVDVGRAIDTANELSGSYANIHFIQANLFELPFKSRFDIVFSMGVLHHTPDPMKAAKAILGCLTTGGKLGVWVYGREGNEFMGPLMNFFRRLTVQLSNPTKEMLAKTIVKMEETVYALIPKSVRSLFYGDYLDYFNRSLSADDRSYVAFDFLSTPLVHYLSRKDIESFIKDSQLTDFHLLRVNSNSWGFTARL